MDSEKNKEQSINSEAEDNKDNNPEELIKTDIDSILNKVENGKTLTKDEVEILRIVVLQKKMEESTFQIGVLARFEKIITNEKLMQKLEKNVPKIRETLIEDMRKEIFTSLELYKKRTEHGIDIENREMILEEKEFEFNKKMTEKEFNENVKDILFNKKLFTFGGIIYVVIVFVSMVFAFILALQGLTETSIAFLTFVGITGVGGILYRMLRPKLENSKKLPPKDDLEDQQKSLPEIQDEQQ